MIYDAEGRYEKNLVKLVCGKYKNFTYTLSMKGANLMWFGKPIYEADLELCLQVKGFVNRVPGAELFREKQTQSRILNQLVQLLPEDFAFHPQSFCLPRDEKLLAESIKKHPKKLLIAKPAQGCGGDGIYLFKSMRDLSGMSWAKE